VASVVASLEVMVGVRLAMLLAAWLSGRRARRQGLLRL